MSHVNEEYQMLLFDPQTSGGFIIGTPEGETEPLLKDLINSGYFASIIGNVTEKKDKSIYFI